MVRLLRPGAYYRALIAPDAGIALRGRVLDVGAGDGSLLAHLRPVYGVALDPRPGARTGVRLVRGDGSAAPFRSKSFDTLLALDVLEHVEDDAAFVRELVRLVKPGGCIWLSVPSRALRLHPRFLTPFAHRAWGHIRPGYTRDALLALAPDPLRCSVQPWNEPAYRLLYPVIWLLHYKAPGAAAALVRVAAAVDRRHRDGEHGHYFCTIETRGTACRPSPSFPGWDLV